MSRDIWPMAFQKKKNKGVLSGTITICTAYFLPSETTTLVFAAHSHHPPKGGPGVLRGSGEESSLLKGLVAGERHTDKRLITRQ